MNIAYIRVSTIEQHNDRQLEAMKKYDINKTFIDDQSGKDTNRPQFQEMMKFIDTFHDLNTMYDEEERKYITLHIHSLDRIARNTKDLLTMVEYFKSKNVTLISNKENIDTSTATGMFFITIIGAMAEFERANMLERQLEGIAIAKAKGKYKGRKEIDYPQNWKEVYNKYKTREITGKAAMEMLNLKKNTFYKLAKKYEGEE